MRIVCLVENTEGASRCAAEHGLSVYIETAKHRLLSDTGSSELLFDNAKRLGIDLKAVDSVVLSHGHYDHSGGILRLAEIAPAARIYMRSSAGAEHYHGERYIGIDKRILQLAQLTLTEERCVIDDELELFSAITGTKLRPKGNAALTVRTAQGEFPDDFSHEQCLVISHQDKKILLSGCAHNGILNVLDRYRQLYAGEPDAVISGFHMMSKTEHTADEIAAIEKTANLLSKMKTQFVTGHCTGLPAFEIMKRIMGEQLIPLHSGDEVFLDGLTARR